MSNIFNEKTIAVINDSADRARMYENHINSILETEYSDRFDQIRKNMMVISYYKYGPLAENYKKFKSIDAIKSLEKRIEKYKETGNTEFLADIANFAMIEFMYPQHQHAHYTPIDNGACAIDGVSVNEIKREHSSPRGLRSQLQDSIYNETLTNGGNE